jgi:hypothetical protein
MILMTLKITDREGVEKARSRVLGTGSQGSSKRQKQKGDRKDVKLGLD